MNATRLRVQAVLSNVALSPRVTRIICEAQNSLCPCECLVGGNGIATGGKANVDVSVCFTGGHSIVFPWQHTYVLQQTAGKVHMWP